MKQNGNKRYSRNTAADQNRFSEEARAVQRESLDSQYDSFKTSEYGSSKFRKSCRGNSRRSGTNASQRRSASRRSQNKRSTEAGYSRSASDYSRAYSRDNIQNEYSQRRKKSSRKKAVVTALAIVLVLALGGVGAAFAYFQNISNNLNEGLDADALSYLVPTDLAREPFYMLLMGTDGSEERDASGEFGDSYRTDSIMLARIDPVKKKTTLVSIHRDTSVDLGEFGQNKLNAAHVYGGAALSIKTVSDLAEVPISHYAEIDFDGMTSIVDSLGGIEVDVPIEINDIDAGGYVSAGSQTLNGEQALIVCRSRHSYDEFGDGDSYRAANQRLVLAAIAKKILASDVVTISNSVSELSKHITTDLKVEDIIGLAQAMRGLDPATDFYTAMQPTTSSYAGGVWYELTNVKAWKAMMKRVDQGLSPTEADVIDETSGTILASTGSGNLPDLSGTSSSHVFGTGTVTVKNGSGIAGVAAEAGHKLEEVGYTVTTGNADGYDYPETIVIYSTADRANEAKEIATTIGIGKAQLNAGTYAFDSDFLIVIGADW